MHVYVCVTVREPKGRDLDNDPLLILSVSLLSDTLSLSRGQSLCLCVDVSLLCACMFVC